MSLDRNLNSRWGKTSPLHDPVMLANFSPRPTDVLITTAPKAGTTWMQQILHQLRTGGDDSFDLINHVVPWLELPREDLSIEQRLKRFELIPNPRIFKTHCTYEQTPGVDICRIILTTRDPRDCCISFYHHVMNMTDEARRWSGVRRPVSFDQYFDRWLEFGAWYRNVASWWPHRQADNVLILRYEDMKKDLSANIDVILEFLDWSLTPLQRKNVLEYCSFSWMKINADRFGNHEGKSRPTFQPGTFIRKGVVGDYQSMLSEQQEQRILDKARRELEPDCLAHLELF